jgi:DNA-binding NtrC family response regulator
MATPTILLVEDDRDQAILFTRVLTMAGYRVETVEDAVNAQTRLDAGGVALLLADWDLPGTMTGDDLISWAKARYPTLKAVLFSNHPQITDVAAASGADAAFRKIEGIAKLRVLVQELVPR